MEKSTILNGKTHYFDWAIFNSELLNYQRVVSVVLEWFAINGSMY